MPKLLQVNITANIGSTGKIAEQIGACVQKYGWISYVAYGRDCNHSTSRLIKVGSIVDTYFHYIEQRVFDNEGLSSRFSTKMLIRKIQRIQPDIIHLHNIHDHYLNYRILFGYINTTDIKVVWTFHDFWPITGHCMHFISKGCRRFEDECYDCPMRKEYPKSFLDKSRRNFFLKKELFTSCRNLTIVPVSSWVGSMVSRSFLSDKSMIVINNGIDLQEFKPTSFDYYDNQEVKQRMSNKYIIMAVASQWNYDKGLEDYLTLSKVLAEDEVIVLVGLSDEIMKGLPNNIIGIKRTDNFIELAALYTRADVVTVLSSAETFGLTVVEGFACGTPAIVYDNTAPPTLITPGTGLVVSNKDVNAVYGAIQQLRHFPLKSENCRKRAEECFDKDKCFEKYVELYESLLG